MTARTTRAASTQSDCRRRCATSRWYPANSWSMRCCGGSTMPAVISCRIPNRGAGRPRAAKPSAAFFAHLVDVLDHLDDVLVVLVADGDKLLVFAIRQFVECRLVLGRCRLERRLDGLLQIGRQIRRVGVGRAGQ